MTKQQRLNRDIQILLAVHRAQKDSSSVILQNLSISKPTLQKCLSRMHTNKLILPRVNFGGKYSPFPARAMISIDVDPVGLASKNNKFNYSDQRSLCRYLREISSPNMVVETADILLGGPADIVLVVSTIDSPTLLNFVTNELRGLPGIKRTNTATMFSPEQAELRDITK